ncbi:MAG: extracellular solute-binding protein, partial [Eubacteriales bacterium]
ALLTIGAVLLTGCQDTKSPLNPKYPTTITMWHNYGGEMQTSMTVLVDSFNAGAGKEKGIIVRVDAVSSSAELTKNLDMILDENPAAPEMPNIAISYPKTAVKFAEKGLLCDLTSYFTQDKTDLYADEFISEGKIGDALYVFPVAKSTEVLFVNQTLFERFSAATGVNLESLSTFEGICDTSIKYYEWCGKSFFTADSWFNLFSVAGQQTSDSFIIDEALQTESHTYKKLYAMLADAVSKGGIKIYDGYSSDLAKTGDIVCSLGSTAGILYYGDSITYSDNTTERVEYTVLPYPTVNGGEKIALQRGNGMMVKKSTEAEEYASAVFLEWLTQPEQNMQFIRNTGYLPVTKEAFSTIVDGTMPEIENDNIGKLLTTAVGMVRDYKFYIPPVYDDFDFQSKTFEADFKAAVSAPAKAE